MIIERYLEIAQSCFSIFKVNRLRFFLTILGITVGVFSITMLLAFISGLQTAIIKEIEMIGSNFIILQKYPKILVLNETTINELSIRKDFTTDDWRAIAQLPFVERSVIFINKYISRIKLKNREISTVNIIGTFPEYETVSNHPLESGRYINEDDIVRARGVGVIGTKIASIIFPYESPIGKELNINDNRIIIVGVLEPRATFLDQERDNVIIVPYSFYNRVFPKSQLDRTEKIKNTEKILVIPKQEKVKELIDILEEIVRMRRGLRQNEENDFEIVTADELFNFFANITKIGFIAVIIIAGISLLVGGIGIMNVMLISISERIREIGIRKAIGATKGDIMRQFLLESSAVSIIGGGLGLGASLILGMLISFISPLKPIFSLWIILLALGFSTAVGIIFGVYPARRAAQLQPIQALRYE